MSGDLGASAPAHRFGGPWTELKLAAIDAYSHFFTRVLVNQPFELWYIDGFAGTGSRNSTREIGGLLEGTPVTLKEEVLAGSARRALAVEPPFQHLVLIDDKDSHYRALCKLEQQTPGRDIRPLRGDANEKIREIVTSPPWSDHPNAAIQRALVFLDPYGMTVRWPTLEVLAKTERADVWYLANLKAAVQQLAHNHHALDDTKRRSLSDFFGTTGWEREFYEFQESEMDLFNPQPDRVGYRNVTREQIAGFYRRRLESIFRYVSKPLSLTVKSQPDYFQLYCLSNNPSDRARALIKKGADHVIKKHAAAFRQMSGL